jgi:hypothetical protein
MPFPKFGLDAPYEMDPMNLLMAYGYAIASFAVMMFFPWIHVWWAYEKFANGEFY